jgi:hypothetical protein
MKKILILMTVCIMFGFCSIVIAGVEVQVTINDLNPLNPDGGVGIVVKTEEGLLAEKQNKECTQIRTNMKTGVTTAKCPEGAEYKDIKPERFFKPVNSLITITSEKLQLGQTYLITVGATSQEEETVGLLTRFSGEASTVIELEVIEWERFPQAAHIRR